MKFSFLRREFSAPLCNQDETISAWLFLRSSARRRFSRYICTRETITAKAVAIEPSAVNQSSLTPSIPDTSHQTSNSTWNLLYRACASVPSSSTYCSVLTPAVSLVGTGSGVTLANPNEISMKELLKPNPIRVYVPHTNHEQTCTHTKCAAASPCGTDRGCTPCPARPPNRRSNGWR